MANDILVWLNTVAPLGTFWYVLVFLGLAMCVGLIMLLFMLFAALCVYLIERRRLVADSGVRDSSGSLGEDTAVIPNEARSEPTALERKDAVVNSKTRDQDVKTQVIECAAFSYEHIFIANVSACSSMLEEYVLLMSVEGSNRCGYDVEVTGVEGNVTAKIVCGHDTLANYGHLPHAVLRENYKLASGSDFLIFVEQRVTKKIADEIRSSADSRRLFLLFEDFHLVLRHGTHVFPLQIGDGISVYISGDRLMSFKCVMARPVVA